MPRRRKASRARGRDELAIVLVMVGLIAAFALPKFLNAAERSRAAEAFSYLSAVQAAQQRHFVRNGEYAPSLADLDVDLPALEHFQAGLHEASPKAPRAAWTMTLTRKDGVAGFGAYTVVFTHEGFDSDSSTIARFPEINPMQTHCAE